MQFVDNKISDVDYVLYTHHHADHILGIDDLRFINIQKNKNIEIYGRKDTLESIKKIFSYIFKPPKDHVSKPLITTEILQDETRKFGEIKIEAISLDHNCMIINGYIIEDKLAYLTDFKRISKELIQKIKAIDYLILGCVYYDSHPNHLSYNEALDIINEIKPKMTYLTHTSHIFEYEDLNKKTPKNIQMGFDGLTIDLDP